MLQARCHLSAHSNKKTHDHFVAREGYEKELESIDVGDGPGLRQAGDEQSTTTQRRDV